MQFPAAPTAPSSASEAHLGTQLLGQMADALAWPLLVLWPDGRLVHANLAGRHLLHGSTPLRFTADCHVRAVQPRWQTDLAGALDAAATQQRRSVLHWQTQGVETAVLTLSPLRQPPQQQQAGTPVLLAVTLPDSQAADLQAFAAAHALTEAETRVLHRLAQAESSPRAARVLGVAQATVRSQTASLRRKTGHASGADLMRALALLPPTATTPAGQH